MPARRVRPPVPVTGFDSFFHLAPIVAMRGTRECNAYYRMLRDELKDRVARGVGGIADERVRLLWDNLPIWFDLRGLSTVLARNGFNIVCATYTNAWAEAGSMIDPADPEGSSARGLRSCAPQPGPSVQAFGHEAALPGVRRDRRHLPQRPFVASRTRSGRST